MGAMSDEIQTITEAGENYPALLREIAQPPAQLYIRGTIPKGATLAVVGTRLPTAYGKQITPGLVTKLAQAGFVIVSGLAYGIDAMAHTAALDAGGATVAVLGTGVDENSLYPRKHMKLARRIIENGGAVISEYEPGTAGRKHHFPARNRIVSGMSLGTVVIEAKQKSGALITAKHALDQNRDVFAVPGSISSAESVGPNQLIAAGATPVLSPNTILEFYGQTAPLFTESLKENATTEEKLVLDALTQGALHVDAIAEALATDTQNTLPILTHMELKGLVKSVGGGSYVQS